MLSTLYLNKARRRNSGVLKEDIADTRCADDLQTSLGFSNTSIN